MRALAHAAAALDANVSAAREFADEFVLCWAALLGAVEIDDVHPLRAGFSERFELRAWVAVARGIIEAALHETYAHAVLQIDGGIDQHGRLKKLSRMRAPTALERSGWNWQP